MKWVHIISIAICEPVNPPVKKSEWKPSVMEILLTSTSISEIYGQINIPVEITTPSNLGPSTIRHFCENSIITHAAFALKDKFAPRFASIQSIFDSMEFLENYEVILAKFSSSCIYILSLSYFSVVFIFCKVGQIVWCIKCHLSVFIIDYCLTIWGNVPKSQIERINKLQKRAARKILDAPPDSHSLPLFRELGWLTVSERVWL